MKNIEKLAEMLNSKAEWTEDRSGAWVNVENDDISLCFDFDENGDRLLDVVVSDKVRVVEEHQRAVLNIAHPLTRQNDW